MSLKEKLANMKEIKGNTKKIKDFPKVVEISLNDPHMPFDVWTGFAKYNGKYKSSTSVNGKPSYELGQNAIWYKKDTKQWIIGPLKDIKSDNWVLATKDQFERVPDGENIWCYKDMNVIGKNAVVKELNIILTWSSK